MSISNRERERFKERDRERKRERERENLMCRGNLVFASFEAIWTLLRFSF